MAPSSDSAKVVVGDDGQVLAQFEPDPDGQGSVEPAAEPTAASDGPADPQWVVWADAEGESDWAGDELTQLTPGPAESRIR